MTNKATKFMIVAGLLITTALPLTTQAKLTVTSDKPADPDIVCKTEADIPLARAQALTRGGGPDFASSAEALCRAQIAQNAPKAGNTTIINTYPTYTAPATDYSIQACKMVLEGGQVIDGKCTCPADKFPMTVATDKYQCVAIPKFVPQVAQPTAQPIAPIATNQLITRTLKLGDSNADVKILQTKLGVNPTGYFGPMTRLAVIAFQKKNAITQTGNVGPITLKALNK